MNLYRDLSRGLYFAINKHTCEFHFCRNNPYIVIHHDAISLTFQNSRHFRFVQNLIISEYVHVDNANVWIEGIRVLAVERGLVFGVNDASTRSIVEQDGVIDYHSLRVLKNG